MKSFKVSYYFDGNGDVTIYAENKEEAYSKFHDGDYSGEREYGQNYAIEEIKEDCL